MYRCSWGIVNCKCEQRNSQTIVAILYEYDHHMINKQRTQSNSFVCKRLFMSQRDNWRGSLFLHQLICIKHVPSASFAFTAVCEPFNQMYIIKCYALRHQHTTTTTKPKTKSNDLMRFRRLSTYDYTSLLLLVACQMTTHKTTSDNVVVVVVVVVCQLTDCCCGVGGCWCSCCCWCCCLRKAQWANQWWKEATAARICLITCPLVVRLW